MNSTYERRIRNLLLQARPRLATTHGLEFKPFFGAVAAYIEGRIFASCGRFGFALKLPPKTVARLLEEKGTKPLKYFPKGHVKRDYVALPPRIIEDLPRFKRLVGASVKLVSDPDG